MMDDYYMQQSGSGMAAYSGVRYQRGFGFMGRLWRGAFLPIIQKVLPYLGKTALNTGIDIVNDLSSGENFKESVKRRVKETGENIEQKAMAKIRQMTGSGKRRRRRKVCKTPFPSKKKTVKRRRKIVKRKRRKASAVDFI